MAGLARIAAGSGLALADTAEVDPVGHSSAADLGRSGWEEVRQLHHGSSPCQLELEHQMTITHGSRTDSVHL